MTSLMVISIWFSFYLPIRVYVSGERERETGWGEREREKGSKESGWRSCRHSVTITSRCCLAGIQKLSPPVEPDGYHTGVQLAPQLLARRN